MLACKARVLLLLGGIVIWLAPIAAGQQSDASKVRELKVPSVAREPALILRISAEGRRGIVSVRREGGTESQSLVCPLLPDEVDATPQELAAVSEQFVTQFQATDLDSDGHPDLAGIREFGAKWSRDCVWLYDAGQRMFVKDFLAEQMELLPNLGSAGKGLVSSSAMGPANPWQTVYRIAGAKGSHPGRQLVPLLSCLLETTPDGDKPTSLVVTRYEGGQAVVQRQDLGKLNIKEALAKCGSEQSQIEK